MSMTCLFREPPLPPSPERKPNAKCVCSTINPLESFMFSLFRLSSSAFCVSIAENVQNYGLCKSAPSCSTQCLSCARSKRAIPSWRTDRPTECVTDCLTDGERTDGRTDWFSWLTEWQPDGRTELLTDITVGWLTEGCKNGRTASLTSCFTVWPTGTETDVRTDWLTDGQIDWLAGWLTDVRDRPHDGVNLILAHYSRLAL